MGDAVTRPETDCSLGDTENQVQEKRTTRSSDRINRGVFTSNTDEWATPESFMAVVRQRWPRFDLDPCALPSSAKAERYYTPDDDGLVQPWDADLIWMNPPYGRTIGRWVERAAKAVIDGSTVVSLLPARTDTAWWHDWVMPHASEILFVKGRLHFGGDHERTAHNAPFPSVLVVGGPPWRECRVGTTERSVFP